MDFTTMDMKKAKTIIKMFPEEERQQFLREMSQSLERIFSGLTEADKRKVEKKVETMCRQQDKRNATKAEKDKKRELEMLKRRGEDILSTKEKIIDYETGYHSLEETTKRFEGIPDLLENKLVERAETLRRLRADLRLLTK